MTLWVGTGDTIVSKSDVLGIAGTLSDTIGGDVGSGGALYIIESRLLLRASVGLTVRAPRPVRYEDDREREGATDKRLELDGVLSFVLVGFIGDVEVLTGESVPSLRVERTADGLNGTIAELARAALTAAKVAVSDVDISGFRVERPAEIVLMVSIELLLARFGRVIRA